MDPVSWKDKLGKLFSQYKYVCIVIFVGLVLMTIPGKDSKYLPSEAKPVDPESETVTSQLEAILSMIDGVGKVQVMLTVSEGEKVQYVCDENKNQNADSSSLRRDTVIITDSQRTDQGLIQQVIPPVYLGAIIVCEGGDNPAVQLKIVTAVSNATGLSTDRITVLKMK